MIATTTERAPRALTDRQRQVLVFIATQIRAQGLPPSIREIGNHMSIRSTNGIADHLNALERKGFLHRTDMVSRGIQLTPIGWIESGLVPPAEQLGREASAREPVAAPAPRGALVSVQIFAPLIRGALPLSPENMADTMAVDPAWIGSRLGVFGWIAGAGMTSAGIVEGDTVLCVPAPAPATIADGATVLVDLPALSSQPVLRKFAREGDVFRLYTPAEGSSVFLRAGDMKPGMVVGVAFAIYRSVS